MSPADFDLVVLGAGSAGVRAGRLAARAGARVAVVEERYLGGTCVNVGCVPKKLLVYGAQVAQELRLARGYGWSTTGERFDWTRLIANKNAEIARLNGVYRRLLEEADVVIIDGRARLRDAQTVVVGEHTLRTRHVLIATGGWPVRPEIPGAELGITSNEAFFLERLPARVLIVGGGYVAVEFAGIFHGLGARVVLSYRGNLFLRGFDRELRGALAEELERQGIDLRWRSRVVSLERAAGGLVATFEGGTTIETDCVLFAIGRRPQTADLGLAEVGVALDRDGAVVVDAFSRSSVPGIWAVGDVTQRRRELTPVALHEATAFVATAFGGRPTEPDYGCVPTAIFSSPALATVGASEEDARERYGAIDVYRSRFRPLKLTLTDDHEQVLVKLVVARDSGRVVGAHMLGADAGEIIQGLAIAIKMGATKEQFDATIGIHPTLAEEFVTLREPAR